MPILAVHASDHPDHPDTLHHMCPVCGWERYLAIDPLLGDVVVDATRRTISTAPCPGCAANEMGDDGLPVQSRESFRTNIAPWEAQEPLPADHPMFERWGGVWQHPGSLVGLTFDNTRRNPATGQPIGPVFGGVVEEHTSGYHTTPERVAQCRLIRALMAHPHMASHVPLDDTVHLRRHEMAEAKRAQATREAGGQ